MQKNCIVSDFGSSPKSKPLGHNCCDKCAKTCKCNDGGCNFNLYLPVPETICIYKEQRTLTEEDKKKLHKDLCLLHKNILMTTSISPCDHIGFPTSIMQFGKSQIQEIMQNCNVLFTVSDIMEHVNIWQHKHAISVLKIFHDLFADTSSGYLQTMSDSDLMDDNSFLSLINFSVETTFEECEEIDENIEIPRIAEAIISSHMVVDD